MSRYITCRVMVNGPANGTTEVLDTTIDGGEGEPLIVARFYDRKEAEKFVVCINALAGVEDPAAFVARARRMEAAIRSSIGPIDRCGLVAVVDTLRSALNPGGAA